MERLITYSILFVSIFVLRFAMHVYLNSQKKSKNKTKFLEIGTPIEILYLIKRFGLNPKKLKANKIGIAVSLIDAFIITLTIFISKLLTDKVLLEILVGALLVFVLIFGINEIFGSVLKKKGYDKK